MANGKQPVLVCFLSPDLQIKIVQKSAKPPHIQHPALPTFSETTARRKGGEKKGKEKRNKGTAIDNSLPFAFNASGLGSAEREGCSRHFFCKCACERAHVQRTHVRVYHFYTRVQPGLRGGGVHRRYIHTVCLFKTEKKTSNGKNLLHCEIS